MQDFADHAIRFSLGAMASCGAVTLSNPAEVIKTRMQLQGELQSSLSSPCESSSRYKSSLHALREIMRNEGLRGIQSGLGAAYAYQVALNGTRLGTYDALKNALRIHEGEPSHVKNITCAGLSGALGAFVGSPLFLVKTRLQAGATEYQGLLHGLYVIGKQKGVRKGLYQGTWPAIVRTTIGSAVQLPLYDSAKHTLVSKAGFEAQSPYTYVGASFLSSFAVVFCMNPFDVIMTRNYNMREVKYYGIYDATRQIFRTEGVNGFFKGLWPHYWRLGPHMVATFLFFDSLKAYAAKRGWI